MEVMFESRWPGYGWLLDGTNGFLRESPGAVKHLVPPVDVIEDKDTYHFYFDMPGLKSDSLDARVEEGRLTIAAERKRPEWPNETESVWPSAATERFAGRSSCQTTQAMTISRPGTRTACLR